MNFLNSIKKMEVPNNPTLERRLIISLIFLIVLFSVLYGYFVRETIVNVVYRNDLTEKISDLGSKVSNMEVEYIQLKNAISLEFAYLQGFEEIEDVKFVSRSELSKTLTLQNSN